LEGEEPWPERGTAEEDAGSGRGGGGPAIEAEASLERARGREAGAGCGGWRGLEEPEAAEAGGSGGAVGRKASSFVFSVAESRTHGGQGKG
jgi:hypothetical protein